MMNSWRNNRNLDWRRVVFSSRFDFFFGIFGLVNLAVETFRTNMDNLIFYLAKMALVLAFLAATPTRGRKEDESLKLCLYFLFSFYSLS